MELQNIKIDPRGIIYKYKVESKKFLLIQTESGSLRAGEIHNVTQYTFLVEGKIELITKENNKNVQRIYEGNTKIEIPKGIPHYFRFLEDSIMIENEDENMTTEYYPEYRKIVEESLK
jgi:hypothetical protein